MAEHQPCDNVSVGVIIQNNLGEILLLERAEFPTGIAAPAGHQDDHGSPELTAVQEVFEEVELVVPISGLKKVIDARRIDNQCKRGGQYHVWTVYETTEFSGTMNPSVRETKGAAWYSRAQLAELALASRRAQAGQPSPSDRPVFEPIWLDFLVELGYIES